MVDLTAEQQLAFDEIAAFIESGRGEFYVLHGLAGTGKTTVLSRIGRQFPAAAMCTLTGKAASVLREKTGLPVATVHSTFYRLIDKKLLPNGKEDLIWFRWAKTGALLGTTILLDEVSMIPAWMAKDILDTGVRIVACGDPGQLPPVKGEQFFTTPDTVLRTIHRQALESPIIRQAHRVRGGEPYQDDTADFRVCRGLPWPREHILEADAVIVSTNDQRRELTKQIRYWRGFGATYPDIGATGPQPGEPVMCFKNAVDYGIYNGVSYRLLEPFRNGQHEIVIDVEGARTRVPNILFDGMIPAIQRGAEVTSEFYFGYVITCHKAQGSEWPSVTILDTFPDYHEHRKNWIYTGITRASQRAVVLRYN